MLVNEKANRLRRLESLCARDSQIDSSANKGKVSKGEDDEDVVAVAMASGNCAKSIKGWLVTNPEVWSTLWSGIRNRNQSAQSNVSLG